MPRTSRAKRPTDEAAPGAPTAAENPTTEIPTETPAPTRRRAPRRTAAASATPGAEEPPATVEAVSSPSSPPASDDPAPARRRPARRRAASVEEPVPSAAAAMQAVTALAEPAVEAGGGAPPPAAPAPTIAPDSWRIRRPYVIDSTGKVRYLDTPAAAEPSAPAPPSEPSTPDSAATEAEAAALVEAAIASEAADVEIDGAPAIDATAVAGVLREAESIDIAIDSGGTPGQAGAIDQPSEVTAEGEDDSDGGDAATRRRRRSRRGGRGRRRNGSTPEPAALEEEAADVGEDTDAAELVADSTAIAAGDVAEAPSPLARPRPETPRSAPALNPLEALVARQNVILDQLIQRQTATSKSIEQALTGIERRLTGTDLSRVSAMPRLAVFVDVPNIMYAAERYNVQVDFGKLLDYLSHDRTLIRASAYAPISDDPSLKLELQRFVQPFVNHGYRIVTKPLKRFADGSIKANFDVELAMDILTMSDRLDIVSLVSGDGDFRRLVEIVASKGVRVEVVAFSQSTAAELKAIADSYVDLTLHLRDLCVPTEVEPRPRIRQPRVDVEL